VENVGTSRNEAPINWTPKRIKQLNRVSNKVSHVVDFWLSSILGGYIAKFAVDCTQTYNVTKKEFFKGPRGRYLITFSTWIKMLLSDKNVMNMESSSLAHSCT
jgi:hypothetical protein